MSSTEDMLRWLEETKKPMQDCTKWLQKEGREFDERMNLRMKTFYGPALQMRSREHALAHVGIPSSFGTFINESMAHLVEDWEHTFLKVLTEQQRQDIKNHFDKDFVSYLNTDLTRYASKFDSSAEATDWSFCPEDKPYLLDIIDRTQDKADREDAASFQEFVRKMERMLSRARANTELFKSRHKEIERSQRQTARMLDQLIHKLYGGQDAFLRAQQDWQRRGREDVWRHTYQTVLTKQQRKAIERHFTEAFISSLNTDLKAPDRDVSKLDSSATAGELSFCCEEKAYMMKCH
ncbi:g133 [Coccomyxa viridis]|uniref:G133 protein n=1 Tax=Coccomyxa viridis TaxID=1274662 RepID=A0ABP1FK89_9CHLO